jgi:hypothetical protein
VHARGVRIDVGAAVDEQRAAPPHEPPRQVEQHAVVGKEAGELSQCGDTTRAPSPPREGRKAHAQPAVHQLRVNIRCSMP